MKQGGKTLEEMLSGNFFKTHVRDAIAVKESTFARKPILEYKPNATATQDYLNLVAEYLNTVTERKVAVNG